MKRTQGKQLNRHVEAVVAALEVLDCFLTQPVLTIRQLVEQTTMTRNRVTRLVGSLLHKGYLIEGQTTGSYSPGPKLQALGKVFEANQNLVVVANPILKELASATGESASFYVREGEERIVLARVEGTQAIRFTVAVGQKMRLHAGAAGKVLLAYMAAPEREALLAATEAYRPLEEGGIDPEKLAAELRQIKEQGYAFSLGERNPDAFSIAAPVFQASGGIAGAIAIAGPISRFTPENQNCCLGHLKRAAHVFSQRLQGINAEETSVS